MKHLLPLVAILFAGCGDMADAFTCQQQGVFENTDTDDCMSFVLCNSNLAPLVQDCPSNTYYWPEGEGCFSTYNCATSSMPGNENPCEGFDYQSIPDKSVADCSRYLQCSFANIYNDGYVKIPQVQSLTCPSGTVFKPNSGGCVNSASYQCSNYPCTTQGFFEDPNANSCSTFIACSLVKSWSGTASYLYADLRTCPFGTKYSPFTQKCDSFYNCDDIDEFNGGDPCADFNWANPFVPNPFDTDATSYIECSTVPYSGNSVTILRKVCPANFYFSPLLGKCYNNYDPNETCSKDPCSSGNGKYVDYKSGMCENFIECRDESKDATSYKPVYEKVFCPPGTSYSPELKECSKQYVCPTFPANYCYPQIPTTTSTTTTMAPSGK